MHVSLALMFVYTTGLLYQCSSINPAPENCLNYESTYHITRACDCVVYQSYGLNNGIFTSPNFPQFYPSNINCILYSFIGDASEIIELTFMSFDLKMPDPSGRCGDYVRIFQNLERPEVNEHSQYDLEFCGGYSSIPKTVFSAGRSLVLEFHSDFRVGKPGNYTGFKGNYQFLDKRNYLITGSRVEGHKCMFDFHSNISHHSGRFFSPGYPQDYKPNSSCRFRFFARLGERVRLLFTNIQLHHIDASCRDSPDVITVYDGTNESAPVIGEFCGVHNAEEVISTGTNLFVAFTCDDRNQKQGFAASYEFINKISTQNNGVRSIKNDSNSAMPTSSSQFQCNENMDSRSHRNGTISSPFYPEPYPSNIRCRYIFTGGGRERIQLRFLHMDLHVPREPTSAVDCKEADSVSVYIVINGKTEVLNTWCGRKLPPMLMSSQHNMIVEFQSLHSSKSVTGFKAQYSFVTNFGIHEGQQDNRGMCVFNYQSSVKSSGEITSPNYNGLYPRNTECHYLFYGRGKERVQIIFVDFDVDGLTPRCEESTYSDYVSFSNFAETEDRKMTRLCGQPPAEKREIWSDGPFFRVIFKSNEMYDSTGFQAYYQFKGPQDEHEEEGNPHGTIIERDRKRNSGNTAYNSSERKHMAGYLTLASMTSLTVACLTLGLFLLPPRLA
ncbi:unnamed protein product [Lymnaea stagnalis]|uniref:CUB domain-containing protein n=1 Tax=Lymnaea stagnalis TaxID=6523 RepID=A0AAV2I3U2_LYMST